MTPEALAALHARCFPAHPRPWSAAEFSDLIGNRLNFLLIRPQGFLLGRVVADEAELRAFGDEAGWPVVLKTPRGGYDGKGVRVVGNASEAADWFAHSETLLAEERVDFTRELAVLVARSPSGQACAWPVVQTVQTDGICTHTFTPAPDLSAWRAGNTGTEEIGRAHV